VETLTLVAAIAQERLRVIWSKYYSESHGVVFVVDSANERRFEDAKSTLRTSLLCGVSLEGISPTPLLDVIIETMLSHSELQNVPLLLLANKEDLEVRPWEASTISGF
jgi:ADP-ribosylation factor related protein 1